MDRTANARRLRDSQTLAESRLWTIVRAGRLQGFKFKRQVPIDRYFVDFLCSDRRLIIELDGKAHQDRGLCDAERTEVLEDCGFHVIRFPNEHVLTDPGGVAEAIPSVLKAARP
jgi:very-short-patch-repair endonuclease